MDYKDDRAAALRLLDENGNPYVLSVSDVDGRVAIDYGVYGVPESYLIDRNGVVRFKQVGPITDEIWQNKILPLAKQMSQ